jgi:uncharacterized protein (DUF924 family)
MTADEVLEFWFSPAARPRWFRATPAFDAAVRERFEAAWRAARRGAFADWEETPAGALALVILLDQLPLNMFRDRPEGYATEALGRAVAERAIARGFDAALQPERLPFLYLPFMHSEDLADQDRSVALFEAAHLADNLRWARHHRDIVRRFGRFPHRNAALGRPSSVEEAQWLQSAEAFKP